NPTGENQMSEEINNNRRRFLGTAALSIAAAEFGMIGSANAQSSKMTAASATPLPANMGAAAEDNSIRPFRINVPEEEIVELRRRINATKWPERETVTDASQGVQLATTQKLARYWATDHDWSKCEARLNALPQFMTN